MRLFKPKPRETYCHIDTVDSREGRYFVRVTTLDNSMLIDSFEYTAQKVDGKVLKGDTLRHEIEKLVAQKLEK